VSRYTVLCHACQSTTQTDSLFSFRLCCQQCDADLHVCYTCKFYEAYADNQCKENAAEYIADKTKNNLCDYWRPREKQEDNTQVDALAKLKAAFGEQTEVTQSPTSKDEALDRLNQLFKK
jgi:hypothetical protein